MLINNTDTSVVISIHNQADIIYNIMTGLINNCSDNVKELLVILDGCTDKTEDWVCVALRDTNCKIETKLIYTDDIWETKANNIGFKSSSCHWIVTVQDDALIQEKDFDKRLLKPFYVVDNLLGVSGRNAQDESIVNGELRCFNVFGKDRNSPRNIFGIRDVIVRTPLMFNHEKLAECNYLDEDFAPLDGDDKNLSYYAYKNFGYLVGAYVIDYRSDLMWGKTRNNAHSNSVWAKSAVKNIKLLIDKHYDLITGEKHDQDIEIN